MLSKQDQKLRKERERRRQRFMEEWHRKMQKMVEYKLMEKVRVPILDSERNRDMVVEIFAATSMNIAILENFYITATSSKRKRL